MIDQRERILGGLWGSLVGDALGVPVEFRDRVSIQSDPVSDMRGHGTHDQPPGTWSDDGSLVLCTVDSLVQTKFDLEDMGRRFEQWLRYGLWTARGDVFDVGHTTHVALKRFSDGCPAEEAGGKDEYSNGNGSLMRIIPVALRFADFPLPEFISRLERASAITHAHPRSKAACGFYGLFVRHLMLGKLPQPALEETQSEFVDHYRGAASHTHFQRLLRSDLGKLPEGEVLSTGYVLHTLHASLWCLLNTDSYADCVLKAVNLGGDTDTTGCVAGGLAGVYFGMNAIPKRWLHTMARFDEVDSLLQQFANTTPVIS